MKTCQCSPSMGEIGNIGNLDLGNYHISFCSPGLNLKKYHIIFLNFTVRGQECWNRRVDTIQYKFPTVTFWEGDIQCSLFCFCIWSVTNKEKDWITLTPGFFFSKFSSPEHLEARRSRRPTCAPPFQQPELSGHFRLRFRPRPLRHPSPVFSSDSEG